jgi:hypothetical protein
MPVAFPAPQPDVRPEPVDQPLPAPAGVRSKQIYDVAKAELDDPGKIARHYAGPN